MNDTFTQEIAKVTSRLSSNIKHAYLVSGSNRFCEEKFMIHKTADIKLLNAFY